MSSRNEVKSGIKGSHLNPDAFEIHSDMEQVFSSLVHLLRNPNVTQYIKNHPAAYNEVLAAVQEIPRPKHLPTPTSTPREEPDSDGPSDQLKNNLTGPDEHRPLQIEHDLSQRDRSLCHVYAEDANASNLEQTNLTCQRSGILKFWPPPDHDNDTHAPHQDPRQYEQPSASPATSLIPRRLDTLQPTSSKRNQDLEDGRASKRIHIELAHKAESGFEKSNTRFPTRQAYEQFALRYYMLVPSWSWTAVDRDMANKVLTAMLEASKGQALDMYQLGLTDIFIGADTLALLENERARRLDHCVTVIQKNVKATYYHRRYLKAREAILFAQSIIRKHLAWKYVQKMKAATTIQRIWRGQRQRTSLDVVRNNVTLIQAAAKGFLRRREIMNTRAREAAVLIRKMWRLRRHIQSWRRYKRRVIIVQTLWRIKCTRRRIRAAEAASDMVSQGDHENDWIAQIPAHWRTQLQRIKSREVLEDCQLFLNKVRHPVTSIDIRPDQNAMERCGGPDETPTRDRRLKRLGFMIKDGWEKEESLEVPKMVLQILRRVHLAELTAKYMEKVDAEEAEAEADKAAPKGGRQPTVKERYVNLLFPHTVKHTSKNTGKGKKSGKGKKGGEGEKGEKGKKSGKGKKRRKGSSQTGEQLSPEEVRAQAEDRFEYWIRLGKPLWKWSQQYGFHFLVILPKEVTITSLFALRKGKGHEQAVVDYVDFCYPGLKEQISNLSCFLRGIVASEIPTKRLVIETIPSHDLSDHPFEELFQFSSDRNSSELGEPSSEELSQMSKEAVNTPQTDTAVRPSNQRQANKRIQGTIESVQDTQPDSTSESLQSFSPSSEIKNGSPSNSIIDYSESAHPSAYHEQSDHHEELSQQSHRHINNRSPLQDIDGFAQSQPSLDWGLDPQDYFIQDDD